MSGIYRMGDGTVVKTGNATRMWEETRTFDGRNRIGDYSRSQYSWATLYRSRRGRYYVEYESNWQETPRRAEWVSPEEAARFLILCGYDLPEELLEAARGIEE